MTRKNRKQEGGLPYGNGGKCTCLDNVKLIRWGRQHRCRGILKDPTWRTVGTFAWMQ